MVKLHCPESNPENGIWTLDRFTPLAPQPPAGEAVAGNVTPRPWRIDGWDLWESGNRDSGFTGICAFHRTETPLAKANLEHIVHCVNTHDALSARVAALEEGIIALLAEWGAREKEYKDEWLESAVRGNKGESDRLSAADIRGEISVCIRQLESVLRNAQPQPDGKERA